MRNPFKVKEKTTLPEQSTREVGVSGNKVIDTYTNEEKRLDKVTIDQYWEMIDNDATVEALVNVVTLPILAATYTIKADDEDKNEEQAKFVRSNLLEPFHKGGMETPFALFLEQLLTAQISGFSFFERVMRIDDRGKITIKKLAYRDATTIKLIVDEHGGYNGARQQATFGDRQVDVTFDPWNTFLFTYGKSRNFLYGRSALRSLYRNYDKKKKIEYFDTVGLQAGARKPLILKRTADNTIKNKSGLISRILGNLNKLGELKSAAAIPYGFDISTIDVSGRDPNDSIERQNSEMARRFLASFILLGTQGSSGTGSYALSSNQSDMFMISLRGVMNLIADHINQYLIADLIDLNFPVSKRHYPYFQFDDLTSDTVETIKNAFTTFIQKDRISDDMAKGIEQAMANKLDIDLEGIRADREEAKDENDEDDKEGAGGDANSFPDEPVEPTPDSGTSPEIVEPEIIEEDNAGDEDNGTSHDHNEHDHAHRRALTEPEKAVKFNKIEAWFDKRSTRFEEDASPLLTEYMEKVAEDPDKKVELPEEYIQLLTRTFKESYNYGKLAASDELSEKAPVTKDEESAHLSAYLDFVTTRQTNDIKSLVDEARLNMGVSETTAETLARNILNLAPAWVSQVVRGTSGYIVAQGMRNGRDDAFASLDIDLYQWSALLENTCDLCLALDGKVCTQEQKDASIYQPPVHPNCRCIWVGIKEGEGDYEAPEPTGIPEGVDDVNHIQNTIKSELEDQGIVKPGETKKEVSARATFNQINNGDTVADFEKTVRGDSKEFLAAWDGAGNKIAEVTDGLADRVNISQAMADYLKDNGVAVMSHNHPIGYPFSGDDLAVGNLFNLKEMRVASEGRTFILIRKGDIWTDLSWDNFQDMYEYYLGAAYDEWSVLTNSQRSKLDYNFWIQDRAVAMFAEDFMLEYIQETV